VGRIPRPPTAALKAGNGSLGRYRGAGGAGGCLLERARATGKINDPVLRQEIAKVLAMSKAAEWTARRRIPRITTS
jgi:hypothetical protein